MFDFIYNLKKKSTGKIIGEKYTIKKVFQDLNVVILYLYISRWHHVETHSITNHDAEDKLNNIYQKHKLLSFP